MTNNDVDDTEYVSWTAWTTERLEARYNYDPPVPGVAGPRHVRTLAPEEMTATVMKSLHTTLPLRGAAAKDGVVHAFLGNATHCGEFWAYRVGSDDHPYPGWVGWNALEERDVDCIECLAGDE